MSTIKKFEDLECWQEARKLVRLVYELIGKNENFQRDFRLSGQIVGAAISVMNNIAEGFDSQTNPEFIRFLKIARRSTSEVQSCAYVALDRKFILQADFERLYQQCEKCRQVTDGMLRYLRSFSKRAKQA